VKDYECHITVEASTGHLEFLTRFGENNGWKTSFINGDPDFGKGNRFFFTNHFGRLDIAIAKTELLARSLEGQDIVVSRKKIEEVIMDTKADNWNLQYGQ
jgi:hypothetical protein